MNDIFSSIQTSVQQQLMFFLQNKHKHVHIFYKVIMSTLLASFTANVFNRSDYIYYYIYTLCSYIKRMILYKKKNTISLISKKIWTRYGRYKNIISDEKLGILYYISKRLDKFDDLTDLVQDYRITTDYNNYSFEKDVMDTYYSISQNKRVEIFRNKNKYICAYTEETEDDNPDTKSVTQKLITDKLILESNLSLVKIRQFVKDAKNERQQDIDKDPNRYIYTYLGEDDDKNPIFEQEKFRPYCNFNKLVGEVPKKIEQSFDFFSSEKGKQWHTTRNLPYQLTVLLYGQPGTGKSCIASAVATKYNLHIVRIKLSLIKTNYQFIKAFKNRVFNEKNIDYENILYLFDELDTENNHILKKRSHKSTDSNNDTSGNDTSGNDTSGNDDSKDASNDTSNDTSNYATKVDTIIKKYNVSKNDLLDLKNLVTIGPSNDERDALTLGTILEELNGINQMYGRKMFIISNHPEQLDSAILRPGRIDLKFKLDVCSYCEIIDLIRIFFNDSVFDDSELQKIKQVTITAAKLTNLCKISKTKDLLMQHLVTQIES
jgi:hypothetical protein